MLHGESSHAHIGVGQDFLRQVYALRSQQVLGKSLQQSSEPHASKTMKGASSRKIRPRQVESAVAKLITSG